jgi:ketosteroid isomerase-like protein
MTATDNEGVLRSVYEAFRRGDIAAVLAAFDDDIELEVFGPPRSRSPAGTGGARG